MKRSEEVSKTVEVPRTREGRIKIILANIKAHPGVKVQALITKLTLYFGVRRRVVQKYFRELSELGVIRTTRDMRVFPVERRREPFPSP